MRHTPALFSLYLALALSGCSAPPPSHSEFAPLLSAIEQRLELASSVARHKWVHNLPVQAPAREAEVLLQVRAAAGDYGLAAERAEAFFADQIEANKLVQYALLDRWRANGQAPQQAARDLSSELRPRLDKLQGSLLFELGQIDHEPPADCTSKLAQALAERTHDPLRHLALVRATGQLCRKQ
ncbi:chorismate mutase [Pseudomonas xanthosomatis]|uniref:chorismate mutase n=1 Tax=Pseudomonas xanthosomatis TaxID=2842356 RepID=UPI003516B117